MTKEIETIIDLAQGHAKISLESLLAFKQGKVTSECLFTVVEVSLKKIKKHLDYLKVMNG